MSTTRRTPKHLRDDDDNYNRRNLRSTSRVAKNLDVKFDETATPASRPVLRRENSNQSAISNISDKSVDTPNTATSVGSSARKKQFEHVNEEKFKELKGLFQNVY